MPTVQYKDRGICATKGCRNKVHLVTDYGNGWANYRLICGGCHLQKIASRHGITVTKLSHRWHPYLSYRKDYCENQDGRLGFVCTTNIFWEGMLDVDHKNGNSDDNRPRNLQTLCKCCHAYKTMKNKDYRTPGRKTLKRLKIEA